MIVQWRDSILTHLKGRGTEAACNAIERVSNEFPDLKGVRAQLLEARVIYRQRSWRPPQSAEILKMADEQRQYLIRTTAAYDTERIFRAIWVLECEETFRQGTAFMLAGVGLITCRHVLGGKTQAFHRDDFSKKYQVKILAEDKTLDLAVLGIDAPASAELVARYSPELVQGEQIAVAGYPNYNWGDTGTLFPGVVGGFHMFHSIRSPLISAPIIQGASGGPILDTKGKVVGVAVKGAKHTDETNSTEHVVIPITALRHLDIEGRPVIEIE
jgi:S1-C subfamily serine protease